MSLPRLLEYESNYPLYGIAFSHSPNHPFRIALTTLLTGPTNKLFLVDAVQPDALQNPLHHSHHHHHHHHQHHQTQNSYYPQNGAAAAGPSSGPDFHQIASINMNFPATKVGWEPRESLAMASAYDDGGRGELIATSGDALRIYEVTKEWGTGHDSTGSGGYVGGGGGGAGGKNGWSNAPNGNDGGGGGYSYSLKSRSMLSNSKTPHTSLPPVTSFSWNPKSPNSIVTCSIDTTATLWDINTSQALTQLIAHDRAVYDLSWLPDSSDIFVSVGADGSLRAFDLRQLEHSTILYESSKDTPLARIAFSNKEQHMMACFGLDDSKIMILDMRSPGQPVAELVGHQAPLGGIAWGSPGTSSRNEVTGGGWLASCGDDSQVLLYDLTSPLPETRPPSTQPPTSKSPNTVLSPPMTPGSQGGGGGGGGRTPSPSQAVEVLPVSGWTAHAEVNNLAFSEQGDWLGCVSGAKLNVLRV
ncbi:hypothetical protein CI109_105796 [Kwoniella shandongensis]|uniref:Uncharacterized protein n=1 Tax=Kwoniella shandongensis TaxID=1734106 RepID=A0A5M6C0R3_9TREE|nr:uncharacterized protein CI109_003135 [Kwoniella shandongensis]KAA5528603.1 hypothetical protein CI109_003135 [Kwoniella shandongensis]